MKKLAPFLIILLVSVTASASDKDSTILFHLPDSVQVVQLFAEIKINYVDGRKVIYGGIQTDAVKLYLEADRKEKEFVFEFPKDAIVMATGLNVDKKEKGELTFEHEWQTGETYKLLIAVARDSAENFSLYSGYAWMPKENKWKLIGTIKINGQWSTLSGLSGFYSINEKQDVRVSYDQVWTFRRNGTWKDMKSGMFAVPVINLFAHVDSSTQRQIDIDLIKLAIQNGKTDVKDNINGVYYKLIKEGTGKQVSINDTILFFYKLKLLNTDTIIEQQMVKPTTYPLKDLIKGWQVGIPLCKVGCKIKLVLPSDMAYSIRTRAAKIPPNSILEFELEIVEAKSKPPTP